MDYNIVEDKIKPLVERFNAVPFIETTGSCEGHPYVTVRENGHTRVIGEASISFKLAAIAEENKIKSWLRYVFDERGANPTPFWMLNFNKHFFFRNDDGFIYSINIQSQGASFEECRLGLDEGIKFLTYRIHLINKGDS